MKRIIVIAILNLTGCFVFAQQTKQSEYKITKISPIKYNTSYVILTIHVHLPGVKLDSMPVSYAIIDKQNKPFSRSLSSEKGLIQLYLMQPQEVKEIFIASVGFETLRIPIKPFIGSHVEMDVYLPENPNVLH